MTRKRDVHFCGYATTVAYACKHAWEAGKAFFAHAGQVYFCLGPGTSSDDWHPTGLEVKELAS